VDDGGTIEMEVMTGDSSAVLYLVRYGTGALI
jgi:hypothetical protein